MKKDTTKPPYNIVLADPCWPVPGAPKSVKDFKLMGYDWIASLNVRDYVAETAYLFCWIMTSTIPHIERVMAAWGFKYIGVAFVWEKVTNDGRPWMGIGHYTRPSVELCCLGVRGNPNKELPKRPQNVMQLQRIKRPGLAFAQKPDEFHKLIVHFCGDLPRIELFARRQYLGWGSWGNECRRSVDIHPVSKEEALMLEDMRFIEKGEVADE